MILDMWEKILEAFGAGGRGLCRALGAQGCSGCAQTPSYLHCGWFSLGRMSCTAPYGDGAQRDNVAVSSIQKDVDLRGTRGGGVQAGPLGH